MLPLLAAVSPNAAILILTLGIILIALELNRPGSILPGAIGLLLALFATASLAKRHPQTKAVLWIVVFIFLLMLGARGKRESLILAAAITAGLIFSIYELLPAIPGQRVSAWAAVLSGLILGAGTTVLTGIARRARQNKGLD
jgi:membrane-bound serine protease (ClpP class)